jgi:hypothetical protein
VFGYININQKELTEEGKKAYQAYYCGLCRQLKSNCGTKGQMLLAYDMTFLIVLLTGLYELPNEKQSLHVRCIRRRSVLHGSMTPQNMRRI